MRKVAAWILVFALAIFGGCVLTLSAPSGEKEPVDVSDISYKEMTKGNIYFIKDLLVVDTFAEKEDGKVQYLMVMFQDMDEKTVAAIMPVNQDCAIWDDVMAYIKDDTQQIGDYALSCYVKTETNTNVDGKLHGLFDTAVEDVQSLLGASVRISKLSVRLDYVCDEDEDPAQVLKGTQTVAMVVGIVTLVAAAGIAIVTIVKSSSAKSAAKVQYTPVATPVAYAKPAAPTYQVPYTQTSPAQVPRAEADSVLEKLNRYQALKNAGYMTEEEFEKKRKELLEL